MVPFLHTHTVTFIRCMTRPRWKRDRAERVKTMPSFKYFPIKPTRHHIFSPSSHCSLCSSPFPHIYLLNLFKLWPWRTVSVKSESNPFVVVPYRTESYIYLSLSISCVKRGWRNRAVGSSGHRNHSGKRSEAESLVRRKSGSWLRMTISCFYLVLSGGFHAKRRVMEIKFALCKSGFESPLCKQILHSIHINLMLARSTTTNLQLSYI